MYRVETSTGQHQQLSFALRAADEPTEALSPMGLTTPPIGSEVTPFDAPTLYAFHQSHTILEIVSPSPLLGGGGALGGGALADGSTSLAIVSSGGIGGGGGAHTPYYGRAPLGPLLPYLSELQPPSHRLSLRLPDAASHALMPPPRDALGAAVDGDVDWPNSLGAGEDASGVHGPLLVPERAMMLDDASMGEMLAAVRVRGRAWVRHNPLLSAALLIGILATVGGLHSAIRRRRRVRQADREAKEALKEAAVKVVQDPADKQVR